MNNLTELGIAWAPISPPPAGAPLKPVLRIQQEYFARIDEIRRALRSSEAANRAVYVGTVEQLNGELGEDGRRAGEVILGLLRHDESSITKAAAMLTADQYKDADVAHMNDGYYVKVTGTLHPGRQPHLLDNIEEFSLISRSHQ